MEASAELGQVLQQFYEAMGRGDIGFIERHTARQDGAVVIGTDPNEWLSGYQAVVRAVQAQTAEFGGAVNFTPGDVQGFREGSVGWAVDRPVLNLPGGAVPFRISAVFHQEDGVWKAVQVHASLGVANQAVIGHELTV